MSVPLEDYAVIGDCETVALVSRRGSIDWLCLPRFDSPACFSALLGTPKHGRWLISPRDSDFRVRRRYRKDTLVLETDFETDSGLVTLIDAMPPRNGRPDLMRMVVGRRGEVAMGMELILRFDYGQNVPWVSRVDDSLQAIAGPDAVTLRASVPMQGRNFKTVSEFVVRAGEEVKFEFAWRESHEPPPEAVNVPRAIEKTAAWWQEWSSHCSYTGEWRDAVMRSLITLKALTYAPTGGIVAAPTTSLPEKLGGMRNWDYRFCWLRDATLTLMALLNGGYTREACAWRDWLQRVVAGNPAQAHILYGVCGQRRLLEVELDWLPGYENSVPVRTGNEAWKQIQLDVFGQVMDAIHQAHVAGLASEEPAWNMLQKMLSYVQDHWQEPDEGIWEVRGPKRHFTHSKVMAWVGVDRMIRGVEEFGLSGPADEWRELRQAIHDEVCERGFDKQRGSFVQFYGSRELDGSLLTIPLVGFLPADDPRVKGTVAAIERDLMQDGFVLRYDTKSEVDGLPPGEGAFLPCSFWLADNYALQGRHEEARELFGKLLDLCNDVGLLSEEYDPTARRLVGNFPQAFSHVGLINSAMNLHRTASAERKNGG